MDQPPEAPVAEANITNTNGNAEMPATNGTSEPTTTTTAPGLSADEIALYDRQIRLWGAQAQERIRSANILLVSLRALGTEIAKNLTLAGISSLTIVDDEPVTEDDLGAGYFLREEDIGKPRAEAAIPRIQELNPRVNITSDGSLANLLAKNQTHYHPFSVIIACDHDFLTLSALNTAARVAGRPFYAAGIHGMYGFIFADLVTHDFILEREKSNIPTAIKPESVTRSVISSTSKKEPNGKVTEIVTKRETYCPLILANSSPLPGDIVNNKRKLKQVSSLLPCLRALFEYQRNYATATIGHSPQELATFTSLATTKSRELQLPAETLKADFLRSFIQNIGAELITTAAFVGGRLSEDVINVLGKREQPIQNFALFDGEMLQGPIYCLYSPPPEVALAEMAAQMGAAQGMANGAATGAGDMGAQVPDGIQFGNGTGMGMPGMDASMGGAGVDANMGAGFDPSSMANGPGADMGLASNGVADSGVTGGPAEQGAQPNLLEQQEQERQQEPS